MNARMPLAEIVVALLRDPSVRASVRELVGSPAPESGAELLDLRRGGRAEQMAGVRARTIRDAAARGEVGLVHVGRRVYVRRAALVAWLASRPATRTPVRDDATVIDLYEREVARTRRTG